MMKKLKILIISMVLAFGVAFYVPTVQATTTEITTELTTENAGEVTADETLNTIKSYITLLGVGFLSSATFAGVGGYILNLLKKKALKAVLDAVNSNQISQATANKATSFIEESYTNLTLKFETVCNKFDELSEKVALNEEKMSNILDIIEAKDEQLSDLIIEYLGED